MLESRNAPNRVEPHPGHRAVEQVGEREDGDDQGPGDEVAAGSEAERADEHADGAGHGYRVWGDAHAQEAPGNRLDDVGHPGPGRHLEDLRHGGSHLNGPWRAGDTTGAADFAVGVVCDGRQVWDRGRGGVSYLARPHIA
jgi:hypothetical protein